MRLGKGVLYLVFHWLIVDSKVDVLLMTVPNGNMGCQLSRGGIENYILRSIGPNNSEPVQIVLDWIRTFRTCFKKAQFSTDNPFLDLFKLIWIGRKSFGLSKTLCTSPKSFRVYKKCNNLIFKVNCLCQKVIELYLLISKCLIGVFTFFQKTNKNKFSSS